MIPTSFDQPELLAVASRAEATIVVLAIAFVVWRVADALTERFFQRRFISAHVPRVNTFSTLAKSVIGLVVIVVGALALLHVWAVDVAPAVWSAGFVTAALAFGSQNLVRDIVTGFFFLFEDQYDVGDRVELVTTGGQVIAGTVDSMELRTTKIVDHQGRFIIIPNGNIAFVTNASRLPTTWGFQISLPWKDDAIAMRRRIEAYAREIAKDAGRPEARVSVTLIESESDHASFRVDVRSADAESDVAMMHLRERLTGRLQADGWLPGHVEQS